MSQAGNKALPPWEFEITASHQLGEGKEVIHPQDTTVRIRAGISPYTLAILAIAASLAIIAGVVKWRGRR